MRTNFLVLLVGCASTACGSSALELSLVDSVGAADGLAVAQISATGSFRGSTIADGQSIQFSAAQPVLFESRAEAEGEDPLLRPTGESTLKVKVVGGTASVFVRAPAAAGALEVTASYTTPNRDAITGDVTLDYADPPLLAAAVQVGGATTSILARFQFACARRNIPAFVSGREAIDVPCTVSLQDANGTPWPHTPVLFFTEAGEVIDTAADHRNPRSFVYRAPALPTVWPRDVRPMPEEEGLQEAGAGLLAGAVEQNPRDGLVTLLAVVRGHEGFDDLNGNGAFDVGEPYLDEGEPFLDVDDDGQYNAAVDGLACCDNDGNGRVDGPNGQWDADVWLGRPVRILWTGEAVVGERGIRVEPASVNLPLQASGAFDVWAVDGNFNPLAAVSGDEMRLDFDPDPNGAVVLSPGEDEAIDLSDTMAMELAPPFPVTVFGPSRGRPFVDVSRDGDVFTGRQWHFTVKDVRVEGDDDYCGPVGWDFEAEVRRRPFGSLLVHSALATGSGPAGAQGCE